MDHYVDGIRRCHSSPAVSDAGINEPRQDRGSIDSNRPKQQVQKLRLRTSSIGTNAGVLI